MKCSFLLYFQEIMVNLSYQINNPRGKPTRYSMEEILFLIFMKNHLIFKLFVFCPEASLKVFSSNKQEGIFTCK